MRGISTMMMLVLVAMFTKTLAQSELAYTVGTQYVYQVNGIVLNNGYDDETSEFTPGYHSVLSSTLVMEPTAEDDTTYLFVMNMFNTVVSINESEEERSIQDDSLGYDVYFNQSKTGKINEIIYDTDDSPYYLNVKLGAINALQTAMVNVGNSLTITESDPIGVHTAVVSGGQASSFLTLSKTFTQADFTQFPDPTLTPANLALSAVGQVTVHPTGYVLSAQLNQSIILTNISPSSSSSSSSSSTSNVRDMNNATGLNMMLSSVGQLTLVYSPSSVGSFVFQQQSTRKSSTMFEIAQMTSSQTYARAFTISDDIVHSVVDDAFSFKGTKEAIVNRLNRVASHIRINPDGADDLLSLYIQQAEQSEETRDRLFYTIAAAKHIPLLVKYGLYSDSCEVRLRALLASFSFSDLSSTSSEDVSPLVARLVDLSADTSCGDQVSNVAENARRAFEKQTTTTMKMDSSDFPYNKSYSKDVHIGGKMVASDFDVSAFAGTNFDCNHTTFNYDVSAQSSVTATLFGYSQQALSASIVYGKDNGQPLSDAITLSVWGKQVANYPLSAFDCQAHTYPLGGIAPGFSISHIVWVSVIPVVFSATASLDLQASWGWTVCDVTLSADISVSPQASIVVDAYSYTDLILLRAGFELQGSLNSVITPSLFVHGSLCQLGFDVEEVNQPMAISFESFYQWKHCKVIIFDCVWGTRDNQTWWSWSLPASTTTLFQEVFQITPSPSSA